MRFVVSGRPGARIGRESAVTNKVVQAIHGELRLDRGDEFFDFELYVVAFERTNLLAHLGDVAVGVLLVRQHGGTIDSGLKAVGEFDLNFDVPGTSVHLGRYVSPLDDLETRAASPAPAHRTVTSAGGPTVAEALPRC